MTVFQLNGYYVFLMFFDVIIFQTSFNSLYTVLMYINSFHILYSLDIFVKLLLVILMSLVRKASASKLYVLTLVLGRVRNFTSLGITVFLDVSLPTSSFSFEFLCLFVTLVAFSSCTFLIFFFFTWLWLLCALLLLRF